MAARRCFHTDFETTDGLKTITTFEEMGFKHDLLRGIYQFGFHKPSPIQQRAIVPIIQGHDVIAQAQSGAGKTSMIALTLCHLVDTSTRDQDQAGNNSHHSNPNSDGSCDHMTGCRL